MTVGTCHQWVTCHSYLMEALVLVFAGACELEVYRLCNGRSPL